MITRSFTLKSEHELAR